MPPRRRARLVRTRASAALVAVCAGLALLPGATSCSAATPAPTEVDLTAPVAANGSPVPAPPAPSPGAATAEGTYEIYPGVTVPEEWVDCRTEDDCAIVEAGCCDHCNGGAITTVNRAFAEQARAKLAKVGCERPCTKRACDRADGHLLVCMTRACHFEDLEDEVRERIWGSGDAADEDLPTVESVRPSR